MRECFEIVIGLKKKLKKGRILLIKKKCPVPKSKVLFQKSTVRLQKARVWFQKPRSDYSYKKPITKPFLATVQKEEKI